MRPQLFIEKIMPVKLLNEQVYYEHGGNPFKGLHRWYSRKPLSFSRASVLASLLPADISMEEFLYIMGIYSQEEIEFWEKSSKTEEEKDKLRNIKEIRLYKQPPTQKQIERLKHHCQNIWGNENPAILDAFAGGGSIPFEGVRYGLNVFASDLNPVAVITMKAAMEYPLKFGKDLQQDIDKWVKYVGDEAQKRLADFFPSTMEVPLTKGDLGGSHSAIASSPSSNTTKANLGDSNQGSMIPPSPPSKGGSNIETVQNYLWAHTVTCPHCQSVIPLSPNWWLYKRPEKQNLHKWCAVKPIPNLLEKRVDFELIKGRKGKGTTILINNEESGLINNEKLIINNEKGNLTNNEKLTNNHEKAIEFDPNDYNTIGRGVGKCCNCGNVIEDDVIKKQAQTTGLGHQLYAVAFKQGKGSLEFRLPNEIDLEGIKKAEEFLQAKSDEYHLNQLIPDINIIDGEKTRELLRIGIEKWHQLFNPRQLLTLVSYVEIINDAKLKILAEYEPEKAEAIITYLALVFDRCVDRNCRLCIWNSGRISVERASTQHSLNLNWNYPEFNGVGELWIACADAVIDDFTKLCEYFNNQTSLNNQTKTEEINLFNYDNSSFKTEKLEKSPLLRGGGGIKINLESADSLYHLPDGSLEAIITDPPYYGTIQYAELSDFFYCLAPETLIITQRGYVPIKDIKKENLVLDKEGKWTKINQVGQRDYQGDVFEIRVAYNNQKLTITPGHKVWTLPQENAGSLTGEWRDSSELKQGDYVYFPNYQPLENNFNDTLKISNFLDYPYDDTYLYYGKKSSEILKIKQAISQLGIKYQTLKQIAQDLQVSYQKVVRINNEGEYDKFRILNQVKIDYKFMKLLGYFLAEGSLCLRKGDREEGRVAFVFHQSETQYIEEVLNIVKNKFNIEGKISFRAKEKAIVINFYNKLLGELFAKLCGTNSQEKRIINNLLDAPLPLLKGLICGYWNGDGSKGDNFFQLTTVSPILACQIQLILQRFQIVCHQHFDPKIRTCQFNDNLITSKPHFLLKVWGKNRVRLAEILEINTPIPNKGNYLNIWTNEGQWLPIRHIEKKTYQGKVYNLSTESQNYLTSQGCVHNCWMKRTLGDIFPDIFYQELTDKDREAVANPSRFRNMGESADVLASRDYEAKMAMAWNEAYRVLRDDGVLTVQFNHKESGAWDMLAKALIDAGFEITASWAVSTENPQNLHQAKKNSVSSTVILVCRKRQQVPLTKGDLGGSSQGNEIPPSPPSQGGNNGFQGAWWDDLRPEVANQVEARAGYFEDNDITGIDLYLSAFGVALNVFSKSYPILDNTGNEVRPEVAFAEARKAIASYRFRKLLQTDTVGFDALTQWYLLAWDAFTAREFPFDEARQLALAIGGFNVNDLAREYKLIDSTSGTCKLLTPQQRLKKRAFTVNPQEFKMDYLIDGLHALIAVYEEEGNLEAVRQFMKKTGLNDNDVLTKSIEVAFKVIPDSMKEKQTLINLWLGIDEIKQKVQYFQLSINE